MDAWFNIAHGHVFANAQTGNVVLGAIALAGGHPQQALATVFRFSPLASASCCRVSTAPH